MLLPYNAVTMQALLTCVLAPSSIRFVVTVVQQVTAEALWETALKAALTHATATTIRLMIIQSNNQGWPTALYWLQGSLSHRTIKDSLHTFYTDLGCPAFDTLALQAEAIGLLQSAYAHWAGGVIEINATPVQTITLTQQQGVFRLLNVFPTLCFQYRRLPPTAASTITATAWLDAFIYQGKLPPLLPVIDVTQLYQHHQKQLVQALVQRCETLAHTDNRLASNLKKALRRLALYQTLYRQRQAHVQTALNADESVLALLEEKDWAERSILYRQPLQTWHLYFALQTVTVLADWYCCTTTPAFLHQINQHNDKLLNALMKQNRLLQTCREQLHATHSDYLRWQALRVQQHLQRSTLIGFARELMLVGHQQLIACLPIYLQRGLSSIMPSAQAAADWSTVAALYYHLAQGPVALTQLLVSSALAQKVYQTLQAYALQDKTASYRLWTRQGVPRVDQLHRLVLVLVTTLEYLYWQDPGVWAQTVGWLIASQLLQDTITALAPSLRALPTTAEQASAQGIVRWLVGLVGGEIGGRVAHAGYRTYYEEKLCQIAAQAWYQAALQAAPEQVVAAQADCSSYSSRLSFWAKPASLVVKWVTPAGTVLQSACEVFAVSPHQGQAQCHAPTVTEKFCLIP